MLILFHVTIGTLIKMLFKIRRLSGVHVLSRGHAEVNTEVLKVRPDNASGRVIRIRYGRTGAANVKSTAKRWPMNE